MKVNLSAFWNELFTRDPSLRGSPLSVGDDGSLGNMETLTAAQQAAVNETLEAHDSERADLIQYAADKRWRTEEIGAMVDGVFVPTDRFSQERIAKIAYDMQSGGLQGPSVTYKGKDGWLEIDRQMVKSWNDALQTHVQNCYRTEKQVRDGIKSGAITTTGQIDQAFEPVTKQMQLTGRKV